jgi:hypothetical protein
MMVAMGLHQRRTATEELGKSVQSVGDKIGEIVHLNRQALRLWPVWKEVAKLVLERGCAGRLEGNDRSPKRDLTRKNPKDFFELFLRAVKIAPVVQRTPAAQRFRRNHNLESCPIEQLGCGDQRLRTEVVVERVRPQNEAVAAHRRAAAITEPIAECPRSEAW